MIKETAKKTLYAVVGAPIVTGRRLQKKLSDMRGRVREDVRKEYSSWVKEGEKVVERVSEGKVMEDLTARVDLDQIQEQVGKVREQLEDVLKSWRASFAPAEKEAARPAKKPAAKKPEPAGV